MVCDRLATVRGEFRARVAGIAPADAATASMEGYNRRIYECCAACHEVEPTDQDYRDYCHREGKWAWRSCELGEFESALIAEERRIFSRGGIQVERGLKRLLGRPTVVLDIETSGLVPPVDRVLEVALADMNTGDVLVDTLVNPCVGKEETYYLRENKWRIDQITWRDVSDAPDIMEVVAGINEVCQHYDYLLGWNLPFDVGFLKKHHWHAAGRPGTAGVSFPPVHVCAMREYASIRGVWSDYWNDWQWSKLSEAVKELGTSPKPRHTARSDSLATRGVVLKLCEEERLPVRGEGASFTVGGLASMMAPAWSPRCKR